MLHPSYFKALVTGTKTIAGCDQMNRTFNSTSSALKMTTIIKIALNANKSIEMQKSDYCQKTISNYQFLENLIVTDWASKVSSERD